MKVKTLLPQGLPQTYRSIIHAEMAHISLILKKYKSDPTISVYV